MVKNDYVSLASHVFVLAEEKETVFHQLFSPFLQVFLDHIDFFYFSIERTVD